MASWVAIDQHNVAEFRRLVEHVDPGLATSTVGCPHWMGSMSPVFYAAREGKEKIVEYLIDECRVDVEERDSQEISIIYRAC